MVSQEVPVRPLRYGIHRKMRTKWLRPTLGDTAIALLKLQKIPDMTKKQDLSEILYVNPITTKQDMSGNKTRLQRNDSYWELWHFQALRGNRFRHYSKIMPDGQLYSNFAVWTSVNTATVTFKLMSLGMTDRMAAISDEHADDQTIFYTATRT